MITEIKPTVVTKNVKHTFTLEERDALGGELAQAIAAKRGVEREFDQVKSSYKARVAEAETRIDKLSTDRSNGFDMRNLECVVVYRTRDRKKDFITKPDWDKIGPESIPVLTEDMTESDYQADLIQAESAFDLKTELTIIAPAGNDNGLLIVGKLGGKWFSALRVSVGKHSIGERLDSEQRCYKERFDAIKQATNRLREWLVDKFGKDLAKGFDQQIDAVLAEQKEKAE